MKMIKEMKDKINKKTREKERNLVSKASIMGRLIGIDSGKRIKGAFFGKKAMSKILIGVSFLFIIALIIGAVVLISALSGDERAVLESELNSLSGNLSESGYGWLVNYSVKNGGNI